MNTTENTPSADLVAALLARYEEALSGDAFKSRDCHWQIAERWADGEHLGWFVEHDGYRYEAAISCLVEHLRRATTEAEEDDETEVGAR